MLSTRETEALRRWYSEETVLAEAGRLVETGYLEELEEFLHMRSLFPLSRHSELPDYMRDDEGEPLFPTNLNPGKDLDKWRDAIEVGWAVVAEKFGISHDDVHKTVAQEQHEDWDRFMKSVEERKKKRGG